MALNDRETPQISLGEVILYQSGDGVPRVEVRVDSETVWITQAQLVTLFDSSKANISEHITHIFEEGELSADATVRKFRTVQIEGTRKVERNIEHYNLDLILSVGYRVKSKTATAFRIWANSVLKEYLLQGVAVNQNRLKELEKVVEILSRSSDELVSGVSNVIAQYLPAITLLRDYDEGSIQSDPNTPPTWLLTLKEAREVIADLRSKFPNDALFGKERSEGLDAAIGAIYQGFAGQDIYPTVEQKAAHLLYFVVKNHPLTDGNKRSAAALFVTFLDKNRLLRESGGAVSIDNNTLAALTLMVAMSDPKEKDLMVQLIVRMLSTSA